MTYNISEEQLQQLLDPDMPQCAKEIIVGEVRMSAPTIVPSSGIREKLILLRRLYRWIQTTDGNDSLSFDVWNDNKVGFDILESKMERLAKEMCPTMSTDSYSDFVGDYWDCDGEGSDDNKFFESIGVI